MIAGQGLRWWTPLASTCAAWMATAVLVAAWVAYLGAWVPVSVFVVWALAALAVAVLAWTARFALFVTRRLSRAGRRWR